MNPSPRILLPWTAFVLTLVGAGVFWGIPEWRQWRIRENEHAAVQALLLLIRAEEAFRNNDLDGNRVNDFWTADVAALCKFGLIPEEVAEADVEPMVRRVSARIPYKGYYFKALRMDYGEIPPVAYRQETDKSAGRVHHLSKFGFVAWPAEPGVTGKRFYIVNENDTIFPSEAMSQLPRDWPTDQELMSYYGKK